MSAHGMEEFMSLVCGDLIAYGSSRDVYECRVNTYLVVKVEKKERSFQNITEWETWKWAQCTPIEKWFAPCEQISASGSIMVQRKCEPLRQHELPKRIPAFMADLKIENFGLFKGKFVALDYGTFHSHIQRASRQLIKAKWRGNTMEVRQ